MALNLDKATRDEIYAEAANIEIPGRSKMTKPELIEAITRKRLDENNTRDIKPAGKAVPSTVGARVEDVKLPADINRLFETSRPVTTNRMRRALRSRNAKFYGMQGRGMGAKHFTSRNNPVPADLRAAIVGRGLTGAR